MQKNIIKMLRWRNKKWHICEYKLPEQCVSMQQLHIEISLAYFEGTENEYRSRMKNTRIEL